MFAKMSVKKPMTVFVVMILVVLLGVTAFNNMTTDLLPAMELPYVVVMTTFPGAGPEKVELTVTKPLEQILATTSGIKNISSISRENLSLVILEFTYETNMDSAMIEMSGNIDLVEGAFDDMVSAPTLLKINPDMMPILVASADLEGANLYEISDYVQTVVVPRLERVDGVASVNASGLVEQQIRIAIDSDKVRDLNARLRGKVGSELASSRKKLNDAEKDLQQKLAALNAQGGEQLGTITEALIMLNSALTPLDAGIAAYALTLTSLNTQLQPLLAQKQALEAAIPAFGTRDGLQGDLAILDGQIQALLNDIALLEQAPTPDTALIAQKQSELDLLRTVTRPALLAQIAAAQAIIDQSGAASAAAATTQLGVVNGQITPIQSNIAGINASLATLNEQRTAIVAQIKQAEQGKLTYQQTVFLLSAQMQNALGTITQGKAQLKDAEDSAYDSADLSGTINQAMLNGLLRAQNFSMPAGSLKGNDLSYSLKVGDVLASLEELRSMVLFDTGSKAIGVIRLSDVAEVTLTDNAKDLYVKMNANDAVLFTVQKQSTSSTSAVSKQLGVAMKELEEGDARLRITPLQDQGVYINMVIDSVLDNLLSGAILAIVVLFIFLRSLRPTLVVALSIPLSLMASLVCMYFTGITLNIISLAGLALAIGMLLDNSIVTIENIYRLRGEGVPVLKAAVLGTTQITGALASSTLTTVCVFLPIVFTQGLSRQLFSAMGLTIAFSLISSLAVAITLVPAMASKVLRRTPKEESKWFAAVVNGYVKMLDSSLRRKALWLGVVGALLAISVFGVTQMGTAFLPKMDALQISATLTTEQTVTQAELRALSDEAVARITALADVEAVGAMEGGTFAMMGMMGGMGGGVGGNATSITMYILLKEDKQHSSQEVGEMVAAATADMACDVAVQSNTMDLSVLGGSGIQVLIKGQDLDVLQQISRDLGAKLRAVEGVDEVEDGTDDAVAELRIIVDKDAAMGYGLTVAQVYQKVSAAVQAQTSSTTVNFSGQDLPVIIVGQPKAATTKSNLSDLMLSGTKDQKAVDVRLGDIASVQEALSPGSIAHNNQTRTMTVSASLKSGYNVGLVGREVDAVTANYSLPKGYTLTLEGENATIQSSLTDLVFMLLMAVAFIYMIMVAQFQSLKSPMIVMFTLPLAFTGGLLALWIFGFELSIIAMLGFLVLSGVVVNNGIVFVDYVNQLRLEGMDKREALLLAGRDRIRPILMTAMTTVLGLGTMAFGMGMGGGMLQPMAVVTVGGLTYATLLTLFIVPILYDLFHKKPMVPIDIGEEDA